MEDGRCARPCLQVRAANRGAGIGAVAGRWARARRHSRAGGGWLRAPDPHPLLGPSLWPGPPLGRYPTAGPGRCRRLHGNGARPRVTPPPAGTAAGGGRGLAEVGGAEGGDWPGWAGARPGVEGALFPVPARPAPYRQLLGADGPGLDALLLLLMARVPPPPRGLLPALPGSGTEPAEPGGTSPGGLARSLQRAEAMLRSCVSPGIRLLRGPRPGGSSASDSEEEDEEDGPRAARLEQSFQGLRRAFRAWENPRTETFQGHVLPPPGDAFCYHAVHPRVAERCATLHALLQHRHQLRLARLYSRRLKAASDFLRRLLSAEPRPLRALCEELRAHAGHWAALQRRMRGDAWLRPLLLRRPEAVARMRRALGLLALQAARLLEERLEAALRAAVRDGAPPALLADLFRGLEIYNRTVEELVPEPGSALSAAGGPPRAFTLRRVLALLAAERGRRAAENLARLLRRPDGGSVAEEDAGQEAAGSLSDGLRALCREDERLALPALQALVASADGLWRSALGVPGESPAAPSTRPGSGCKAVRWLDASHAAAAEALHARYRPLCWEAAGAALGPRLELPADGTGRAAGAARELQRALGPARVPPECEEELGRLCRRLQCRDALLVWQRDFARALGSGLSDRCSVPERSEGAAQSGTARLLQRLYPALGSALRNLPDAPEGSPPGSPCPRLQLLGCCLATAQASCSWLMGKAFQYLAAWSLQQFLLVTQGDLQLLKAETDALELLVSAAFPEPGDSPQHLPPHRRLRSHHERRLCQQIRSAAASIQLFAGDVLKLFSTDCKRMSAEIFDQTMPLGRHWRLGLRAELPSSPSEYAAAAAQTVLGQVLQGAQLLPRDSQVPTLARVMTAFVEAWMDHILAQKIKFSLQGALQLQQDFALVRQLVQCEQYGLEPDTRQALLSLRVLQQMDGAILCLLQQPSGKAYLPPHGWPSLRQCCSNHGARAQELGASSLHSLETLEAAGPSAGPPPPPPGSEPPGRPRGGPPESYLSGGQQQWLALRLHGARRWRVPGLPCMAKSPEG
ncbi:coiled-coil domain-containing protein 142 [Numida meleagris]|uniref:coiled-coil domain-containing protein 142 n=1 Tax=Numida meleagris TaxID=8996 RepID=UPI000B3DAA0C|nr:coiled-coil domain-containing protein 142 [Numida meleagris]